MDTSTLQKEIITGIEHVLNSSFIRMSLTTEQIRLLKTNRAFWEAATGDDLSRLLQQYNNN